MRLFLRLEAEKILRKIVKLINDQVLRRRYVGMKTIDLAQGKSGRKKHSILKSVSFLSALPPKCVLYLEHALRSVWQF